MKAGPFGAFSERQKVCRCGKAFMGFWLLVALLGAGWLIFTAR